MGYQTLIDTNLNRAFNLSKDLAKDVTFVKKNAPSFNFGNGQAEFTGTQSTTVKSIIYISKKNSKEKNTKISELLVKSKDIGDATIYDSVTIDAQSWAITGIIKNDGFVSILEISKEM